MPTQGRGWFGEVGGGAGAGGTQGMMCQHKGGIVPFFRAILNNMGRLATSEAIEFFALVILAGHLCYYLAVARLLFIFLSFPSISVSSSVVPVSLSCPARISSLPFGRT